MGHMIIVLIIICIVYLQNVTSLILSGSVFNLYFQNTFSSRRTLMSSIDLTQLLNRITLLKLVASPDFNFQNPWVHQEITTSKRARQLVDYFIYRDYQWMLPTELVVRNQYLMDTISPFLKLYQPKYIRFPLDLDLDFNYEIGHHTVFLSLINRIMDNPARCADRATALIACRYGCHWACIYLKSKYAAEIFEISTGAQVIIRNRQFPMVNISGTSSSKKLYFQELWYGKLTLLMMRNAIKDNGDGLSVFKIFASFIGYSNLKCVPLLVWEEMLLQYPEISKAILLRLKSKILQPTLRLLDTMFPTRPAPWGTLSLRLRKWRNSQEFKVDKSIPQEVISLSQLFQWWTCYDNLTSILLLPDSINLGLQYQKDEQVWFKEAYVLTNFLQEWYLSDSHVAQFTSKGYLFNYFAPRKNQEMIAKGLARCIATNLFYKDKIGFPLAPQVIPPQYEYLSNYSLWSRIEYWLQTANLLAFVPSFQFYPSDTKKTIFSSLKGKLMFLVEAYRFSSILLILTFLIILFTYILKPHWLDGVIPFSLYKFTKNFF